MQTRQLLIKGGLKDQFDKILQSVNNVKKEGRRNI